MPTCSMIPCVDNLPCPTTQGALYEVVTLLIRSFDPKQQQETLSLLCLGYIFLVSIVILDLQRQGRRRS